MPYKLTIGLRLKIKREELGLTIDNIVSITGIPKGSVYRVESGSADKIDFYVKYSKAVKYELNKLMDVDLSLVTINNSDILKKRSIYLTKNIRDLLDTVFFLEYKSTNDVKEKLIEIELIDNTLKSSIISNVLINLSKEGSLAIRREGNKNLYKRNQ